MFTLKAVALPSLETETFAPCHGVRLKGGARLPIPAACRIITDMTAELLALAGYCGVVRRDRRRVSCHVRQVSMYVAHVVLGVPQGDIAEAFGRDRTTVGHACAVVEDRRDEPDFDAFVTALERLTQTVFLYGGAIDHG